MACAATPDRERAVKEVAQAYERIKMQHPLLLHHRCSGEQQLAHSLLGEALRALNVALSVMKQQQQPAAALSAPPLMSPGFSDDSKATMATITARGGKRRGSSSSAMEEAAGKRSSPSSWVSLTTVPYEDGYEWRKYGEKRINGASHTRSYFRCTYRDDTGCQATKHVQQQPQGDGAICSDPPVFQVTYNNRHTCCNSRSAAMNDVKQEVAEQAPVVLPMPPLVDAIAFERTPLPCHQEPVSSSSFPTTTSMQQLCGAVLTTEHYYCHGETAAAPSSTTATSPCISVDSTYDDEYFAGDMMMPQMAAAEKASSAAGDHDVFYDLELFLLCDSFKDYKY
ncbi:hypothetical protein BS78_05G014400 [Paspalum vaginatum]|nr:hypothetical protein BS78_05G014400 [Paspalum vaginatum]